MADDSLTYCDSEEECFFGKVSDKELLKSAVLGQNYASPAVRCTPRQQTANLPGRSTLTLPDVLQGSTNVSVRNDDSSAVGEENENNVQSKHFPSVNSSFNESDEDIEIIEIDNQNDSVQIISDDESFLKNENLTNQNTSKSTAEYQNVSSNKENIKSFGVSELENKSISSCQVPECETSEENRKCVNDCLSTSIDNVCEITTNTGKGGTCELDESDEVENVICSHGTGNELVSNEGNADKGIICEIANMINKDNDFRVDAFGESIDLGKSEFVSFEENKTKMICDKNSELGTKSPAVSAIETLIQASIQIEKDSKAKDTGKSTFHCHNFSSLSELSDLDHSSLNAVSDSILNISHGSSIFSPVVESSHRGLQGLQSQVIYDDISCDGDQVFGKASETSSCPLRNTENDDLHMSLDEPDFIPGNSTTSSSVSQPSLYESCLNTSHVSRYYSANNNEHLFVSQQPSSSFTNYRETLEDSALFKGANTIPNDLETNDEAKKETRFETKKVSKLPVYHGSTNILRPSKLNVKPNALKGTTFNWAEHFTKLDKTSSIEKCETKIESSKANIASMAKSQRVLNKFEKKTPSSKIPSHFVNKPKTPSGSNQPGEHLNTYPSRSVQSDSKTPKLTIPSEARKVLKPALASSEKNVEHRHGKLALMASQEKQKYRHIVSPIQAYINASPVVLHKKAESPRVGVAGINVSRIPTKTPIKTSEIERLHFQSHQGQENVNPNYSRDTLPPRTLEPSSSVFIRDPEQPRTFPKMGATMQKLLDTHRPPKVIHHQGRVNEPPTTKGVLIPNTESNTSSEDAQGRISVRVVKSAENTNRKINYF